MWLVCVDCVVGDEMHDAVRWLRCVTMWIGLSGFEWIGDESKWVWISLMMSLDNVRWECVLLHCIQLHPVLLHFIASYCSLLCCVFLCSIVLRSIVPHCIRLYDICLDEMRLECGTSEPMKLANWRSLGSLLMCIHPHAPVHWYTFICLFIWLCVYVCAYIKIHICMCIECVSECTRHVARQRRREYTLSPLRVQTDVEHTSATLGHVFTRSLSVPVNLVLVPERGDRVATYPLRSKHKPYIGIYGPRRGGLEKFTSSHWLRFLSHIRNNTQHTDYPSPSH